MAELEVIRAWERDARGADSGFVERMGTAEGSVMWIFWELVLEVDDWEGYRFDEVRLAKCAGSESAMTADGRCVQAVGGENQRLRSGCLDGIYCVDGGC